MIDYHKYIALGGGMQCSCMQNLLFGIIVKSYMMRRNIMANELDRLKGQLENAKKREQDAKERVAEMKKMAREKAKAKQELERKIKALENKKARAARTKRLIEIGAYIEYLTGGEFDLENHKSNSNQENLKEHFSKWKVQ